MIIDCDCCAMNGTDACQDCVVTALLDGGPLELDPTEMAALDALADVGLVPRLRLAPQPPDPPMRATG
jgi:hypothetical protein